MSKWSLKSYLERALAAWREDGNRRGMMVLLNGREARLVEVHTDFLLVSYDDQEQTAMPLSAIEEITLVKRQIGAEQTT